MSKVFRIKDLPFSTQMPSKATQVKYIPQMYVYDDKTGLCIKWQVKDVHVVTKVIEGPVNVKYEEDGHIHQKQRYNVAMWPEIAYSPTSDVLAYLQKCQTNGLTHYHVYMESPPINTFQKWEDVTVQKAHKKVDKLVGGRPAFHKAYTTFEIGDLDHGKKKQNAVSRYWAKIFGRGGKCLDKRGDGAVQEASKFGVKRLEGPMVITERIKFLMVEDVNNAFWRMMERVLDYKKLKITSVTCDLDIMDYMEFKRTNNVEEFVRLEAHGEFLMMEDDIGMFFTSNIGKRKRN